MPSCGAAGTDSAASPVAGQAPVAQALVPQGAEVKVVEHAEVQQRSRWRTFAVQHGALVAHAVVSHGAGHAAATVSQLLVQVLAQDSVQQLFTLTGLHFFTLQHFAASTELLVTIIANAATATILISLRNIFYSVFRTFGESHFWPIRSRTLNPAG